MPLKESLKNSLNKIREISSEIYHQYVPIIDDNTDIGSFGAPILNTPVVMNEFVSVLVNRIAYTSFEKKYFRNPLQVLEGTVLPLGYAGQDVYVNPAKGRKFNQADFAGLLVKYEADVKVQYHALNMDVQYPVTVTRQKLKEAFVSWEALETFISELSNSLYNGAYIDEYQFTKGLVSSAYNSNQVQIEQITAPSTEALAKEFITKARTLFLNFQTPSSSYNAWEKVGGYGRPIKTWTRSEDIVFLIRNDIRAYIDVNVLASAFNIASTELLGRILTVDNFNQYDEDDNLIFDGSNIVGMIADKSWFNIKRQDMFLDEFYNANNRTWQYYLNLVKMYSYSFFANAVVFSTAMPTVTATKVEFVDDTAFEIEEGEKVRRKVVLTPVNSTSTVTFSSSASTKVKVTKISNTEVEIEGVEANVNAVTITATCESTLTDTISVTCVAGE